jgi:hypothetical protein
LFESHRIRLLRSPLILFMLIEGSMSGGKILNTFLRFKISNSCFSNRVMQRTFIYWVLIADQLMIKSQIGMLYEELKISAAEWKSIRQFNFYIKGSIGGYNEKVIVLSN